MSEELEYTIPIVEHNKIITKHLKEIERLNNIIKELEKGLERVLNEAQDYIDKQEGKTQGELSVWYYYADRDKRFATMVLDRIKELKGSESNE